MIFVCVAEGIGVRSTAYPYGAVALTASLLVDLGGGFEALRGWARIPRPRLCLMEDPAPNAFATGRDPANSVIGVTQGLVVWQSQPSREARRE